MDNIETLILRAAMAFGLEVPVSVYVFARGLRKEGLSRGDTFLIVKAGQILARG